MKHTFTCRFLILTAFLLTNHNVWSATALVAVAANFTKPMNEIAAEFAKASGHDLKLSFGSTGKFVAQIENGAPFEILLAADESGPQKLEQSGNAVLGSRFIYALGKLVLWSATPGLVDDQGKILTTGSFQHLAIADPKLAPYGVAAIEAMQKLAIDDKLTPLLVQGENIAQTLQFVTSGNAELGFVALSQVAENGTFTSGSGWILPSELYSPIKQTAVLLKLGAENPAATALLDYLKSPAAQAIISKYSYELPR